jgi:ATP-dependent Clp protease ATP-binding subunit ClpA
VTSAVPQETHLDGALIEALALAEELARERGAEEAGAPEVLVALLRQDHASLAPLIGRLSEDPGIVIGRAAALATDAPGTDLVRLVELAGREAASSGGGPASPAHLLVAVADLGGPAAVLLAGMGGTGAVLRGALTREEATPSLDPGAPWSPQKPTPHMLRFGIDLTEGARVGRLDPLVGREAETERVVQILSRRTKSNPVLVGEPGVGKTAIVEGLAMRIVGGDVPHTLRHRRIISLDVASLVAGAKFRGEFEERLKGLLGEIAAEPEGTILFIDELHTVIGAGAAEGGVDAANVLKPMLARGQIRTIGATTLEEYRLHVERDAAFERRFQPVHVDPPDVSGSTEILRGLRPRYEDYHRLEISDEALAAAATLSDRYITGRFLPDKAIDLMDEAAGAASVAEVPETRVGAEDIAAVVARWTGIPVTKLMESDAARLAQMEQHLHQRVVGQEAAVRGVSVALRTAFAGLADPARPIGSFLFVGPTGVGKTLLARALAEFMFATEEAMVRLDMSEYMEREAVTRLIGPPPGYVGHERGGQLTEAVRERPYSLVLLDEIEKAHRDVQDLLLQVMDDGRLTDGRGRTVDFRNVVLIMTSNLGDGEDPGVAVRDHFRAEFLGRLDDLVVFAPLTRAQLREIATVEIAEAVGRAARQGVELSVSDAARELVVAGGQRPDDGARRLRRVVRRDLLAPVARAIVSGAIPADGRVEVDARDGSFVLRPPALR